MKKLFSLLLCAVMVLSLVACGEKKGDTVPYKIGIVTGSVSQSEDDRRGAEAFQKEYGEDMVQLAIYPDNFTEETETTIQSIQNLTAEPHKNPIIVNHSDPGTTEHFHKIPRRSARSKRLALTSSASQARLTRICPRSAPLPTWSPTTTSCPAAI